jgi:predicted nucleic acid-binding protein
MSLSRVFSTACPHHAAAATLLERAQSGDVVLCVLPQVLAEFYAVVTDARRVECAMTVEEAIAAINAFLTMPGMTELPVPADLTSRWLDLARQHNVTRGYVFDVVLAASMLGNGVRRIYTFNRSDFERFGEVEVLDPSGR